MSVKKLWLKGDPLTLEGKPRLPRRILIQLGPDERSFLLHGLCDVSVTSKAIMDHPPRGLNLSRWTRQQIVRRLTTMCRVLRDEVMALFLTSPLDKAIIVEAIGGNPYFAQMKEGDPRMNAEAVRQMEALRERMQIQLRCAIRPVQVGEGMTDLRPPVDECAGKRNGERKPFCILAIYIFTSAVSTGMKAFTADEAGANLPADYAPWIRSGVRSGRDTDPITSAVR